MSDLINACLLVIRFELKTDGTCNKNKQLFIESAGRYQHHMQVVME
jgi:hypothetical protein